VSHRPLDGAPAQLHDARRPAEVTVGLVTAQPDSSPEQSPEAREEAEIEATLAGYREWVAAGRPGAVSHEEAMAELLCEEAASPKELEDAEDTVAVLAWKARDADGLTTFAPSYEARRRLGIHG
jgi:hypothetical protein